MLLAITIVISIFILRPWIIQPSLSLISDLNSRPDRMVACPEKVIDGELNRMGKSSSPNTSAQAQEVDFSSLQVPYPRADNTREGTKLGRMPASQVIGSEELNFTNDVGVASGRHFASAL